MHLPDTRPLARLGALIVLHDGHPVIFKDDSTLQLHRVTQLGVESRELRGFMHGDTFVFVTDVRGLVRNLRAELCTAQARDIDGLISFSLRLAYATADELRRCALDRASVCGVTHVEPQQQPLQFFPSTGHADFLGPDTGDRRFWPVPR